jgi:hypothetical protein
LVQSLQLPYASGQYRLRNAQFSGGVLKIFCLNRSIIGQVPVLVLSVLLTLTSCAGGSSSKIVSDDESASSSSDWSSTGDTDFSAEEIDFTDSDSDGVPDYMEEPYGTEDNPLEYPDVYSQLEDDPTFEDSTYPSTSDYIDLESSAGMAVAAYMLVRGIAKNTPLCVTPPSGRKTGNILSLDQTALVNAGIMATVGSTIAQITFTMGGTYTRTVLTGTTVTGIDAGTYVITGKGQVMIQETGLTCLELYSAYISENPCTPNLTPEGEYIGWLDPLFVQNLISVSFYGQDVQTGYVYYQKFINSVSNLGVVEPMCTGLDPIRTEAY